MQEHSNSAFRIPHSELIFDPSLPVCQHRDEICSVIADNQVVILCGETGSGKSTQLPKILLEMGLAERGVIGHTQPRRIAAISIARRISEEISESYHLAGSPAPPNLVGYKIRFNDRTSADTKIKLMTDGILLAEIQHDRLLKKYSVLIIDEAHERSLNIDFLLGYIKRILPKRRDLKLIITSATINAEKFAEHFGTYSSVSGFTPAPVVSVSGRTYPVEIRYCPPEVDDESDDEVDQNDQDDVDWQRAVVRAVSDLCSEGYGDILVFMPTEYDILETAKLLRSREEELNRPDILPLFARLTAEEQQKIFLPSKRRKIVIATNVAESSITVPGIRYVVDTGTARISRYSARTKTQRLPIEAISQASADQRAGRCGRIGPGICVRLYSEQDYQSRDKYTTPEIQRTNLATAILQTVALKLGDLERFPFIDPPRSAAIRDGYNTLFELGALDKNRRITAIGKNLSTLPVDVRIGRMILAAEEEDCLDEVLVIASALELQDPRERPLEKAQAADAAHEQFVNADSDFLSLLKLWNFYDALRNKLSRSQLRKACFTNFLSANRMREWTDLYRQLQEQVSLHRNSRSSSSVKDGASFDVERFTADKTSAIHRAVLTGLLSNIAFKQPSGEYLTSGGKYFLWPGSGLRNAECRMRNAELRKADSKDNSEFRIPNSELNRGTPQWLVAAEMVETSKRFLRCAAKIDPGWIEPMAEHLVKRSYTDPYWSKASGSAVAFENVSLFGLPIVVKRKVRYGKINPAESRQLLIQSGLVEGNIDCKLDFYSRNVKLQSEMERLQAKMRRPDFLYGEWKRYEFYDARIPADVYDLTTLRQWCSNPKNNKSLIMTPEVFTAQELPSGDLSKLFPDTFQGAKLNIPLEYAFRPGEADDGISVQVPVQAAHQLSQNELDWGVPGLLELRIAALIKSLPKSYRRSLVPAPDTAAWVAKELSFGQGNFLEEVARRLSQRGGQEITPAMFDLTTIDDGLKINVQALDANGEIVAQNRDLDALVAELGDKTGRQLESYSDEKWTQDGLTGWTFGSLPESVTVRSGAATIYAFPTLIDAVESVQMRLAQSLESAQEQTFRGVIRLIQIACRRDLNLQARHLPGIEKMRLYAATWAKKQTLESAIAEFLTRLALGDRLTPDSIPRNEGQFNELVKVTKSNIGYAVQDAVAILPSIWELYHSVQVKIDSISAASRFEYARQDVETQLNALFEPDFLVNVPIQQLRHYPRFLKAILMRFDALAAGAINRDQTATETVQEFWDVYCKKRESMRYVGKESEELVQFRWLIEEFRVSLFAQKLGTRVPVSEKRLNKLLENC